MTRINLVPPSCLSDKHLLAEYRELPRIFTAVEKIYTSGGSLKDHDIPLAYKLGTGHVKFFYNKLLWLCLRYESIFMELKCRGVNLNRDMYRSIRCSAASMLSDSEQIEWYPTIQDIYLNMARLVKRATNMPLVELELFSD